MSEPTAPVWKSEFRATLKLAWPIMLAQFAGMALFVVDMIMVGRLGMNALGAVALGNSISFMIVVLGSLSLSPINPMAGRAAGGGKDEELAEIFRSGIFAGLLISVPIALILANSGIIFHTLGGASFGDAIGAPADKSLLDESTRYAQILAVGIPFSYMYQAAQNTLRGMRQVKVPLYIMLGANLVNLFGNWVLIFGHLGLPALGTAGCAWATVLARIASFVAVLIYIQANPDLRKRVDLARLFRPVGARVKKILSLGLPAGAQAAFDYAIYAAATIIITRVGAEQLAAHQITHNLVFLLMVTAAGISQAGMIRLSNAIGENQPDAARRALNSAFALVGGLSAALALLLAAVPHLLLRLYTNDAAVLAVGEPVMRAGAFFLLVNGVTTVGLFATMGLLDTRVPSFAHIGLVWFVGLPLGYFGAVRLGYGSMGMWIGLASADVLLAGFLAWRSYAKLPQPDAPAPAPATAA